MLDAFFHHPRLARTIREGGTTMTPAQLKRRVEATGSHFFERSSMRFFGDTMRNYKVTGPTAVTRACGDRCMVYELERKHAVKHGLAASAYFDAETFERVFIKRD